MIKPVSYQFQYDELNITSGDLEYMMGYSEPGSCPEPIVSAIKDALNSGQDLCSIRGGYAIADPVVIDRENKRIRSHDHWFYTKQIVTHQLRRSEKAAWFLCTAGEEISAHTARLMKEGDLINGYVIDVLANVVVEEAMDRIQADLQQRMSESGLKTTNRYSPGYCDWDLAEQEKLFDVFPENYLDIRLSSSSLMHPIKSVSGLIGIGTDVRYNEYTCNLCDEKNCIYRNRKNRSELSEL